VADGDGVKLAPKNKLGYLVLSEIGMDKSYPLLRLLMSHLV
jgi:hypothetical protein